MYTVHTWQLLNFVYYTHTKAFAVCLLLHWARWGMRYFASAARPCFADEVSHQALQHIVCELSIQSETSFVLFDLYYLDTYDWRILNGIKLASDCSHKNFCFTENVLMFQSCFWLFSSRKRYQHYSTFV